MSRASARQTPSTWPVLLRGQREVWPMLAGGLGRAAAEGMRAGKMTWRPTTLAFQGAIHTHTHTHSEEVEANSNRRRRCKEVEVEEGGSGTRSDGKRAIAAVAAVVTQAATRLTLRRGSGTRQNRGGRR